MSSIISGVSRLSSSSGAFMVSCLPLWCCSVKSGGNDPATNSKLADLIRQAKDLGVPKDIVDRNLKKASDAKQADFSEVSGVGVYRIE
jgi:hypothetical protein